MVEQRSISIDEVNNDQPSISLNRPNLCLLAGVHKFLTFKPGLQRRVGDDNLRLQPPSGPSCAIR